MSPDPYISIHMYLRILCKIPVSDSCLSIFIPQGPLQNPCLRIHVSTSICISGTSARSMSPDPYISIHMHLRILCEIHTSGFMSQHPHVSHGTSARSMSPDPYISIHIYLRILCKIHVSDSCLSIYMSQGPLQDPCLWIHVSASSNLRILCKIHVSDSCLSIHVSASLYRRVLCKIHVSIHVAASLYLRILYKIHVFGFMSQHPLIWILYKIHVFGLMSQHFCISGSSARSMSPDPYIGIHMYLRILCKIHVSGSVYKSMSSDSCLSIFVSQAPLQDPCLRIRK